MKNILRWAGLFILPALALAFFGVPSLKAAGIHVDPSQFMVVGATIGGGVITLADLAKRVEPDGGTVSTIVEMLEQSNPILEDAHYEIGNLPTGHRSTIRTGLPAVYWRLVNQGTPPSKSTTAQVEDTLGILEAWSEIDVELVKLAYDKAAFRLSEQRAFIEAMSQEMAQTLFYGNAGTAPEEFTGLAPRYSSLSAQNAQNIVTGGGAGADNTSIWLIQWGPSTTHMIVPRNATAGLEREDFGEVTVEVTAGIAGNRMRAFQEHYIWKNGLVVRDWRSVVRGANIDVSNLIAQSSNADLLLMMAKMTHRIVNPSVGRLVFYMNRTVAEFLDIQSKAAVSVGGQLSYADVQGRQILSYRGIPIKVTDQILETEAAVT